MMVMVAVVCVCLCVHPSHWECRDYRRMLPHLAFTWALGI